MRAVSGPATASERRRERDDQPPSAAAGRGRCASARRCSARAASVAASIVTHSPAAASVSDGADLRRPRRPPRSPGSATTRPPASRTSVAQGHTRTADGTGAVPSSDRTRSRPSATAAAAPTSTPVRTRATRSTPCCDEDEPSGAAPGQAEGAQARHLGGPPPLVRAHDEHGAREEQQHGRTGDGHVRHGEGRPASGRRSARRSTCSRVVTSPSSSPRSALAVRAAGRETQKRVDGGLEVSACRSGRGRPCRRRPARRPAPARRGPSGRSSTTCSVEGAVADRRGELAADLGADGVDQRLGDGDRDRRRWVEGRGEHVAVLVQEVGDAAPAPASSGRLRPSVCRRTETDGPTTAPSVPSSRACQSAAGSAPRPGIRSDTETGEPDVASADVASLVAGGSAGPRRSARLPRRRPTTAGGGTCRRPAPARPPGCCGARVASCTTTVGVTDTTTPGGAWPTIVTPAPPAGSATPRTGSPGISRSPMSDHVVRSVETSSEEGARVPRVDRHQLGRLARCAEELRPGSAGRAVTGDTSDPSVSGPAPSAARTMLAASSAVGGASSASDRSVPTRRSAWSRCERCHVACGRDAEGRSRGRQREQHQRRPGTEAKRRRVEGQRQERTGPARDRGGRREQGWQGAHGHDGDRGQAHARVRAAAGCRRRRTSATGSRAATRRRPPPRGAARRSRSEPTRAGAPVDDRRPGSGAATRRGPG